MTVHGSCLCGTVRYEVRTPFDKFLYCHCSRCRKGSGSAHAANLFSTTAAIEWLSGQDFIKTYRVPATRHERCFCAECGSALPRVQSAGRLLVVPAGSLDSPIDIRPNAHICVASRAQWDVCLEDVPEVEGLRD